MMWSAMTLLPTLLMYLLLLLSAVYGWFRWTHRQLLSVAAGLPLTHKTWPILGHSYSALGGREAITRFVLAMSKKVVDQGLKTACFWCGPLPIIAIHDMDDIQTVLNSSSCSDKAEEYEYFKFGLDSDAGPSSYSLMTAPGQVWRTIRKHMNPMFHPRNLDHMIPVFNQNSRELVTRLSEHVGGDPVNLMPYTMDTALKTVCNLVFGPGVEIDVNSPDFHGLMCVVEAVPDLFITRLLRPWLRNDAIFHFLYRKELKKLNFFWNNFTDKQTKVVKEISRNKNLKTFAVHAEDGDSPLTDFKYEEPLNIVDTYSSLLASHPQLFTEADMRFDLLSFYCAGTDTLGSAVASCLLALAQFPEMQERLYQEISRTVGLDDDVTLQDLNRMPYLDQVLKETLRWFLIVPYTLRKTSKDVKLSTCTVPAGSTVIVGLLGIHMDPKIYQDPEKFDPDRFSQEQNEGKERFMFVPFSAGPRNCIAKSYAMQLMKIMLVHVLRKYKLRTDMDIFKLRKRLVVTLVSADGYNIRMETRS